MYSRDNVSARESLSTARDKLSRTLKVKRFRTFCPFEQKTREREMARFKKTTFT